MEGTRPLGVETLTRMEGVGGVGGERRVRGELGDFEGVCGRGARRGLGDRSDGMVGRDALRACATQ